MERGGVGVSAKAKTSSLSWANLGLNSATIKSSDSDAEPWAFCGSGTDFPPYNRK